MASEDKDQNRTGGEGGGGGGEKEGEEEGVELRKVSRGIDKMKMAAQRVASDLAAKRSTDAWKPITEFLKASRSGDSIRISKLLESNPELDVNTGRDVMGNSPLVLAVKNDHLEVVESLLNRVAIKALRDALLLSISMDHNQISEVIIHHHQRYKQEILQKTGQASPKDEYTEATLEMATSEALFAAEITPLILAAQRNQFETVKMLLAMGETIEEPHHSYCSCHLCATAHSSEDELKIAKTRLNVFKGLASNAYISLSSSDPIIRAFQLARTLKENAEIEKYFKADYKKLARQLSDFTVKLLDKVRDGKELDTILSESNNTPFADKDRMARLKLAIRYGEKLFVTHPSCQKKLTHLWYLGFSSLQKRSVATQVIWSIGFAILYPILAAIYWIYPSGRVGKFMQTPAVKFIGSAISLMTFVCMLIAFAYTEKPSNGHRLSEDSRIGPDYIWYNGSTPNPEIQDVFIRNDEFRKLSVVISIFVLGYVWQWLKSFLRDRLYFFMVNWYSIMDIVMLTLYIVSFYLRFYTVFKVKEAVDYYQKRESWEQLLQSNGTDGDSYLYWLNADRSSWKQWDTMYVTEASLALANMLCFMRTTYILAASELLGPLLISLKQMVMNILVFMVLFVVVIVAFVVAFHSLYWYYDEDMRIDAETPLQSETNAEENYGKLLLIVRSVYFSLFGMTESDSVEIGGQYESLVTVTVGYALFGAYNWITVIVLLNMLIAMMARSYEFIEVEKDMEWKFDRSKLYLDYIKEGNTLCVPFNLMPTWWGIAKTVRHIARCCCCCCRRQKDKHLENNAYNNDALQGSDYEISGLDKAKQVDKNSQPYKKVMGLVTQRFILHSTTKREEDANLSEEESASTMFNILKRDLSNFRYDVVKGMARQDRERQTMLNNLSQLDNKLQEAREQLENIVTSCHSTEKTLNDDIGPEVTESKGQLLEVGENVVRLKGDVVTHDERIHQALETLHGTTVTIDLTQFRPIMDALSEIQYRVQNMGRDNVGATLARTNAYGRMEYATTDGSLPRQPYAIFSNTGHSF